MTERRAGELGDAHPVDHQQRHTRGHEAGRAADGVRGEPADPGGQGGPAGPRGRGQGEGDDTARPHRCRREVDGDDDEMGHAGAEPDE